MKKIFTSLMGLCLALSGMAQTLTFSHKGEAIANGSTFVSKEVDPTFATISFTKFIPEVDLTSDASAKVFVSVEALDKDNVHIVEFCGLDGQCIATGANNNYKVEKSSDFVAGQAYPLTIDHNAGMLNGAVRTVRATVSAWVAGQEANKVSFTLVMTNDPEMTAVESASIEEGHVTVQGRTLVYDFNESAKRTLAVFALNGVKMMYVSLTDMNGRVALDELPAGQYVYVIESAAGKLSDKFLIQ